MVAACQGFTRHVLDEENFTITPLYYVSLFFKFRGCGKRTRNGSGTASALPAGMPLDKMVASCVVLYT